MISATTYFYSKVKYLSQHLKRPGKHIQPVSIITYQFNTVNIKLKDGIYGTHWGMNNAYTMLFESLKGRGPLGYLRISGIQIGLTEMGCEGVD
jgi:hypothetical protein